MAIEFLHSQYLTDDMIIRYFKGESSEEETRIIENLYHLDINIDNFLEMETLIKDGAFDEKPNVNQSYNKFMESYTHSPSIENSKKPNITPLPKAGQIWSTKRIGSLPNKEVSYASIPRFVYILSGPEPYPLFEDEENENIIDEYPDCYVLEVLPISLETNFAYDTDYIIPEGNDILSIPFSIGTSYRCNMLVRNLENYVSDLEIDRKEELLNVFFYSTGLPFDQDIFDKANKGTKFSELYGDKYDYRIIEEESTRYLQEPIDQLYDFFEQQVEVNKFGNLIAPWFENVSEYEYQLKGKDANFTELPDEKTVASISLYKDDNFDIQLVALNSHRIYLRINNALEDYKKHKAAIFIKDYNSHKPIWSKENYTFTKAIDYLPLEFIFNHSHIKIEFKIAEKLIFTESLKFNFKGKSEND